MDDMLETMYHANGIGLAAIQIGVPKRIIVMDISKKEDKMHDIDRPITCIVGGSKISSKINVRKIFS